MKDRLRVFEAFAGIGAQRIALRNLNIDHEVVGISEIDKYAIKSYEAIHGPTKNFGDIRDIKVDDLPAIDLFTYSFPCQDLSVAGKLEGLIRGKTRSGLLYECEKIIEFKKPKYLLMENVKNLVSKKFKSQFDEWIEYLNGLGYTTYYKVLNAKDYGIPQNRERVFAISILNDESKNFEFPKPIELKKFIIDISENEVDEKFYIKDDKIKILLEKVNSNQYKGIEKDFKLGICIPQATRKGYIEMENGGICDLTYPNSKTRRGRVQEGGKICPTLTAQQQELLKIERMPLRFLTRNGKKTGNDYCFCVDSSQTGGLKEIYENNFRVRKLTPLECWRLMGFDDEDFYKAKNAGVSNTQLYKQAGNSIVVDVLEKIFENLFIE